ncbi:hypothetical protein HDU83_007666 [Entophlyctis luteolus]|nr:hypothetical protein HDU83_007666 [Entophlyctis luteolus]
MTLESFNTNFEVAFKNVLQSEFGNSVEVIGMTVIERIDNVSIDAALKEDINGSNALPHELSEPRSTTNNDFEWSDTRPESTGNSGVYHMDCVEGLRLLKYHLRLPVQYGQRFWQQEQ